MKIEFKKSFLKDIKKIKDRNVLNAIQIGDYRIGLKLERDILYFVDIEKTFIKAFLKPLTYYFPPRA